MKKRVFVWKKLGVLFSWYIIICCVFSLVFLCVFCIYPIFIFTLLFNIFTQSKNWTLQNFLQKTIVEIFKLKNKTEQKPLSARPRRHSSRPQKLFSSFCLFSSQTYPLSPDDFHSNTQHKLIINHLSYIQSIKTNIIRKFIIKPFQHPLLTKPNDHY